MNKNKKLDLGGGVDLESPSEEFQESLQPLRDELSLNLAMADLENKDIGYLGKILKSLASLKELCEAQKRNLFVQAVFNIHGLVSSLVVDEVEYQEGISSVLKLHKTLEEAFERFLYDGTMLESFREVLMPVESRDQSGKPEVVPEPKGNEDKKEGSANKMVMQKIDEITDISVFDSFISDSLEGVEEAEARLMELEDDPENSELINSIFRCFHSLKGAAGFLGLSVLAKLTHNAETVLDNLRKGQLTVTTDLINCLLAVLDSTRQLLIQLKDLADPDVDNKQVSPVDISRVESLLNYYSSDQMLTGSNTEKANDKELRSETLGSSGAKKITNEKSLLLDVVKVPSRKLDELSELVGELVISLSILSQNEMIKGIEDREVREKLNQMEKTTESLRDKTLEVRMVPLESVFSRLTRLVRDLSQKLNKKVKLTTKGKETLVDKLVIDEIYSPLMHIVRNAIDHGLEDREERSRSGKPAEGNITLSAYHQGESVRIEVSDDGKGLDHEKVLKKARKAGIIKPDANMSEQEIYDLIFDAGFSTAEKVTDVSGRGVGLDVVKKTLEKLRGKVVITSEAGKGSTFSLRLPMTASIIEGLVVRIGETRFIAPLLSVRQTVTPKKNDLQNIHDREGQFFIHQGKVLPILRLYEYFKIQPSVKDPSEGLVIIVENGHGSYGLMVDELLHKQQVVIKNIKDRFEDVKGISGGTILGNGQVGFILDPEEIVKQMKE